MTSPTLLDELEFGPTAWVRLWVPSANGSGAEFQRGYTLAELDRNTGEVAIDVVRHESARLTPSALTIEAASAPTTLARGACEPPRARACLPGCEALGATTIALRPARQESRCCRSHPAGRPLDH